LLPQYVFHGIEVQLFASIVWSRKVHHSGNPSRTTTCDASTGGKHSRFIDMVLLMKTFYTASAVSYSFITLTMPEIATCSDPARKGTRANPPQRKARV
jgi:hypothetical protein